VRIFICKIPPIAANLYITIYLFLIKGTGNQKDINHFGFSSDRKPESYCKSLFANQQKHFARSFLDHGRK
jgi:hypothetical protein